MTSEQIYTNWRSSLKSPDDSIFYYHPSLERILLGLAIYAISSKSLVQNLGEAKPLKLLHIYIPDLITAWIDEDDEAFATMFNLTMTVAESFVPAAVEYERRYPAKKKNIRKLSTFFAQAVACGGDMNEKMAEDLLDDLSTDGKQIFSDKISSFGSRLLILNNRHGFDTPFSELNHLNGNSRSSRPF